jgi:hypothetical protein
VHACKGLVVSFESREKTTSARVLNSARRVTLARSKRGSCAVLRAREAARLATRARTSADAGEATNGCIDQHATFSPPSRPFLLTPN